MTAYYNENDPYCAGWLRNLISAGLIAPGEVDDRSIEDVRPRDLAGFTQCHFFAGIGIWSHALRLAGWSDSEPVWTGSCPCQPFSQAGKGAGFADERHLWPHWSWLVRQCSPAVIFGEQVAGKDGLAWLDLVQTDLEEMGYAVGAVLMAAAGFGAPQIRERLYWLADANQSRSQGRSAGGRSPDQRIVGAHGVDVAGLAHSDNPERGAKTPRRNDGDRTNPGRSQGAGDVEGHSSVERLASANRSGDYGAISPSRQQSLRYERSESDQGSYEPGPVNGWWGRADWLLGRDGYFRPVEPGTFPLANGVANRMDKLRAYGNAIIAPQAAEFITVYMDYRLTQTR